MTVLIKAQHKRGIGTIYHNHMVSKCSTVRKTEHMLKKLLFICLLPLCAKILIPFTHSITFIWFHSIMIAWEISVFGYLFYMMSQYHHYEFQRNKKTMMVQLTFAFIYHGLMITTAFFITRSRVMFEIKLHAMPLFFTLPYISIIHYKSHIDILLGINKLDYLVKVSVFQVFKDTLIQKHKLAICSQIDRSSY